MPPRLATRLSRLSAMVSTFLIGALVDRRLLLCGLTAGAFVLTLAFSYWHEGLWRSGAAPVTRVAPQHHEDRVVPMSPVISNPFPPSHEPAPTAAASATAAEMNQPPAAVPPESVQGESQSEPDSSPDADNGVMLARRGERAERGSRSH